MKDTVVDLEQRSFSTLINSSRTTMTSSSSTNKTGNKVAEKKTSLSTRSRLSTDLTHSAGSRRSTVGSGGHHAEDNVRFGDRASVKSGKGTRERKLSANSERNQTESGSQLSGSPKYEAHLPPLKKERVRQNSADTAGGVGSGSKRTLVKKKQDTESKKELGVPQKTKPFSGRKLISSGATSSSTSSTDAPSATDYDFLRRALSDDKQPFLPPAGLRRGRSSSLPTDGGLACSQVQTHLRQLAEKSVSDEALPTGASKSSDSTLPTDTPEPKDNHEEYTEDHDDDIVIMASSPEKHKQTHEWVSALQPISSEPTPATPDIAENKIAESNSKPSSNTCHGVMVPRKPGGRRQSLNLVVVYGSDDDVEFKPMRNSRADFVEKRRWDAFPFGRMYQALKNKLSAPSLVIVENDCDVESCSS